MREDFSGDITGLTSPAAHAAAVTPSDVADLATPARSLFIGGAGAVKVTTVGGETLTFSGLAAGSILPVRVKRVFATGGTDATLIVALW